MMSRLNPSLPDIKLNQNGEAILEQVRQDADSFSSIAQATETFLQGKPKNEENLGKADGLKQALLAYAEAHATARLWEAGESLDEPFVRAATTPKQQAKDALSEAVGKLNLGQRGGNLSNNSLADAVQGDVEAVLARNNISRTQVQAVG